LRVNGLPLYLNCHHVGKGEQAEVLTLLKSNPVYELLEVLLQEDLFDLVKVVDRERHCFCALFCQVIDPRVVQEDFEVVEAGLWLGQLLHE